jgi:hypothetical protein
VKRARAIQQLSLQALRLLLRGLRVIAGRFAQRRDAMQQLGVTHRTLNPRPEDCPARVLWLLDRA